MDIEMTSDAAFIDHPCGKPARSDSGSVAHASTRAGVCVLVQEVDRHWQTFTVSELDDWFPRWRAIALGQDPSVECRDDLINVVTAGAGAVSGLDAWTDIRFHLVDDGAASARPGETGPVDSQRRYARAMAALVLAELPVSLAEDWLDDAAELTDQIRVLANGVCASYRLDGAALEPAVIGTVVDHLCTYFPGLKPATPLASLPKQPACDRATAWVINNVAEAFETFPSGLVALLRRAAADFTVDDPTPAP
jgi:hypothetical protein